MTVGELHTNGWLIFKAIRGSHAYGTNIEGSDVDVVGVYVQPTEDILMGDYIPQVNDDTNDQVFYEIQRFLELLEVGNPNILELLNTPEDCIEYMKFDEETGMSYMDKYILPHKEKFITKRLKHSFIGYAETQISKATGLNKKMNNPMPKRRKDVLDFCYVIDGVKSYPFWNWMYSLYEAKSNFLEDIGVRQRRARKIILESRYMPEKINKEALFEEHLSKWGLSKIANGDQLYAIYEDDGSNSFRGIIESLDATDMRLSSIPKKVARRKPVTIQFNLDGYKQHCKAHKEYHDWVKKRNKVRYNLNKESGKNYDLKNMMHCVRLVEMAEDIVAGKGIVVRRPNRDFLLSIRYGEHDYDDIVALVKEKIEAVKKGFDQSSLPDQADHELVKDILLKVRLEWLTTN